MKNKQCETKQTELYEKYENIVTTMQKKRKRFTFYGHIQKMYKDRIATKISLYQNNKKV